MTSRRIVADAQVFQTPAWHRGMGKYSLELLAALGAREDVALDIVISDRVPTPDDVIATVRDRIPQARLVGLDLARDVPEDLSVLVHNRAVLDAYLDGDLGSRPDADRNAGPTDLLLLSLMQGGIRPAFSTRPDVRRVALVYDLIPLMFPDTYLRTPEARTEYGTRLGELLRADSFLSISRTVGNDLAMFLGIDAQRIVSIDGAPIPHAVTPEPVAGIDGPFVLMPTGNDPRKNNRRAIEAFSRFNRANNDAYSLVVTSTFRPDEVARLSAPGVLFTGNLSGGQLAELYSRADAVLFPPEYEGLGLPILEAMEYGRPIACSDIAVFREITSSGVSFFDPQSIVAIADALQRATSGADIDEFTYRDALHRYTWPRVAEQVCAALAGPTGQRPPPSNATLCVLGPDPRGNDDAGPAMVSAHAELSRRADVQYVLDRDAAPHRAEVLRWVARDRTLRPGVALPAGLDAIHHLANTADCAGTLLMARAQPGILVLHDVDLGHAWRGLVQRGLVSASRIEVERRIEAAIDVAGAAHLASLLPGQRAVVTFTEHHRGIVAAVAAAAGIDVTVTVLPAPVAVLPYPHSLGARTVLSWRPRPAGTARPLNEDARTVDALARAHFAVFGADARLGEVLTAMRLGTVACVPDAARLDLPLQACVQIRDVASAEIAMRPLLEDPVAWAATSALGRDFVASRHGVVRFAEALVALTDSGHLAH